MNHPPQRGMTLVELLVVLAIMAGLAVAIGTQASALRERARAERTARDAEAMAEALRRADGLSLVSDLGRAPNTAEELCLLFGNAFVRNAPGTDGEGNPIVTTDIPSVPGFSQLSADLPPVLPAADTVPAYPAAALAAFGGFTARFGGISLGAGWRGPYCEGAALASETADDAAMPVLRDGFGGPWEVQTDAASGALTALVSRGRDRRVDTVAGGAHVAWQDRDRTFPLNLPPTSLTVNVNVSDGAAVTRLHVFIYQPLLTVPNAGDPSLTLACRYYDAANAEALTATEGLTHGLRAVYVCAETAVGARAAPPRELLLRPGNNALSLTLHPLTAYPASP